MKKSVDEIDKCEDINIYIYIYIYTLYSFSFNVFFFYFFSGRNPGKEVSVT